MRHRNGPVTVTVMHHSRKILLTVAVLAAGLAAPAGRAAAFDLPALWPSCANAAQSACVETLTRTAPDGTVTTYAQPGGDGGDVHVAAYRLSIAGPSGTLELLNFELTDPADPVLGAGSYVGLDAGTYRFVLRLGTFDPSVTALSAHGASIAWQKQDGNFVLTVTATPAPHIGVIGADEYAACVADSWACTGSVGVQRAISGVVVQHPDAAERDTVRGVLITTNASYFSSPKIDLANRTISVDAAGPHYVPASYPTDGLTSEAGKALNPAFYAAHVPYRVVQAMLDRAPEQLKGYLTADTVKARIAQAGTMSDQPIMVSVDDDGVTVDLGLTHFSAPNPEIRFLATDPAGAGHNDSSPQTGTGTDGAYRKGRKVAASKLVSVPKGFKVTVVKVAAASRTVCRTSGKSVLLRAAGTCTVTVTVAKASRRRTLTATISVS